MNNSTGEFLSGRNILVTGASGSVGNELVSKLLEADISRITALDNNETELFNQEIRFKGDNRFSAIIGDVRDPKCLLNAMSDVDLVFHAAALKHVTICERAPFDAVQTNILGIQNIINAAYSSGTVERVIFMSSDKAVNPTNVMGTSKLMGERLITAANTQRSNSEVIFSSTRFGNVLGSRGSVLQVFEKQIRSGGPLTLTSDEMTRFIMSPGEAVDLVIESAMLARGGEVFVTKMPAINISDLASEMISMLAKQLNHDPDKIKIEIVGARPGEKIYEELLNEEELRRTVELPHHFVVIPAFPYIYREIDYSFDGATHPDLNYGYRSDRENLMTRTEIREFLNTNNLLGYVDN